MKSKASRSSSALLLHTALILLASACSEAAPEPAVEDWAEAPEDALDESAPPPEPRDYDQLRQQELSEEERDVLDNYFETTGASSEGLEFFGRLVALQGDGYLFADDILPAAYWLGASVDESLEKGKVPTQLSLAGSGFPNCPPAVCGTSAPVQFAFGTLPPQNLAFRRPDTTRTYYLVVEDAAPSFFTNGAGGGLVGQAATAIENALSNDCLSGSLFTVLRNSAYQALPLSTRQANYRTRIIHGEFSSVCGGGAVGCANFPRMASVTLDGVTVSRLRFGDRVGLVTVSLNPPGEPTTALIATNEYSVGILTHELLHTMGFAHPDVPGGAIEPRVVPGTASGTTHLSIMYGATVQNPNYRATPQLDDRTMMTKLYSGSCGYSSSFRTVTP